MAVVVLLGITSHQRTDSECEGGERDGRTLRICESQKSLGRRTRMVLRARPEEMTTPTGIMGCEWWGKKKIAWPAGPGELRYIKLRASPSLKKPPALLAHTYQKTKIKSSITTQKDQ